MKTRLEAINHAEHVARRAFIKKAAVGAVFALPAIESLTKSDILVKSALAASAPTVDVTGHWTGPATGGTVDMTLTQSGSSVQGQDNVAPGGTIAGSVSGNHLSMTDDDHQGHITTASATINGNTMTGTFSGPGGSGTFTATKS